MKSEEFKTTIKEAKDILKGKTLKIVFVNGNYIEKMSFTSLKEFGRAILKLESKGASFGFVCVSNAFVQKPAVRIQDFKKRLKRGVWNEFTFLATTVK